MDNNEPKSAASQWGYPDKNETEQHAQATDQKSDANNSASSATDKQKDDSENFQDSIAGKPPVISFSETIKRRGFFEAVSYVECPVKRMGLLLEEYRREAAENIQAVTLSSNEQIEYLQEKTAVYKTTITELKEKLQTAQLYNEGEDVELKKLTAEKEQQEKELKVLQDRITEARIKLGEAKAGIINKSLDEAEGQVRKALDIQKMVYDETFKLNQQKFMDEKDHLARLAKCYQGLLDYYEKRYHKVNQHLAALDVDGISPVTTQILTTIGSVSFAAAGFFFSTFAGATGFGNQGMLNFVLQGLLDSANRPVSLYIKIAVMLGLVLLVTLLSMTCNYLLARLKRKSEEEIKSEFMMNGEVDESADGRKFHANLENNNWYAFWLQITPGLFIAGLIILSMSINAQSGAINAINSSSEGLIAGTSLAIALAGLIYLYIIKIVEPRLVKKHQADPQESISWGKANWELVLVVSAFLLLCIGVILIPYHPEKEYNIISVDYRTRFSILLFIMVSLAGSSAFAYGVRSQGLIQTNDYLEITLQKINIIIARFSTARTPFLHNHLSPKEGNILRHVLKQLSFKASLNIIKPSIIRQSRKPKTFAEMIKSVFKPSQKAPDTTIQTVVPLLPWEEKYFPHLTDELKAIEFEYREKKSKVQKAQDHVDDHKAAKATALRRYETDIDKYRKSIDENEKLIRVARQEKTVACAAIQEKYCAVMTDLQDGFHLGMYYRENGIGPIAGFYESCAPVRPQSQALLITNNQ